MQYGRIRQVIIFKIFWVAAHIIPGINLIPVLIILDEIYKTCNLPYLKSTIQFITLNLLNIKYISVGMNYTNKDIVYYIILFLTQGKKIISAMPN